MAKEPKVKFGHGASVQTGLIETGPEFPSTLEWPVLDSVQLSETLRTRAFSLVLYLYPCTSGWLTRREEGSVAFHGYRSSG